MKWLIAPTALKGSLSAKKAAQVMASAVIKAFPKTELLICPIADGGTDTLSCLIDGTQGHYFRAKVMGPLGEGVEAKWGVLGDEQTAVIEMAQAAGLELLNGFQYDAVHSTTYGVGQLITRALDRGFKKFIITLGGSATVDGGAGCLQALGLRLLDSRGKDLPCGGINLKKLKTISTSFVDPRLLKAEIVLLSDVDAVLTGKNGASKLFARQKGATIKEADALDKALKHFGNKLEEKFNISISKLPGSGAAGGMAASLAALCKIPILSGIQAVLDILQVDSKLAQVERVLTAEGKLDRQTVKGKAIYGLSQRACQFHKPVHAFAGKIQGNARLLKKQIGLASICQISPPSLSLDDALRNAKKLLYKSVFNYFQKRSHLSEDED